MMTQNGFWVLKENGGDSGHVDPLIPVYTDPPIPEV